MWLSAMIRQYGVQLLFTVAQVIGFALSIWVTVVVVNWHRDRDERRNVDEKARKIIEARTAEREAWKARAKKAERLAGNRLASMRAALMELGSVTVQLIETGDVEDK